MFNSIGYRKLVNLLHIFIIAPLLWALATNRFPEEYKKYIVILAFVMASFHLYKLFTQSNVAINIHAENEMGMEGMTTLYGSNVHHIKMFDSYPGYDMHNLSIKQGDIVVWTNVGEVEHTVTADNEEFNSGIMKPGNNYTVKFNHKGMFPYKCMFHKGWMSGVVEVK